MLREYSFPVKRCEDARRADYLTGCAKTGCLLGLYVTAPCVLAGWVESREGKDG
jgi:hypothetical protein